MWTARNLIALSCVLFAGVVTAAQTRAIDPAKSTVTIHVFKSGLFSAFAHNHTIRAPIASGQLDPTARRVNLSFHSADLKVLDPEVNDKDRVEIQKTMEGPTVLDVVRFPEITFLSRSVEPTDSSHYLVKGDLTLHGLTKPVELPVAFGEGRYTGSVKIKQTNYGMTPIKIAGGTVKVKDEVEISFEIVPAP